MNKDQIYRGLDIPAQIAEMNMEALDKGTSKVSYLQRLLGGALVMELCTAIVETYRLANNIEDMTEIKAYSAVKWFINSDDDAEICEIYSKYSGSPCSAMWLKTRNASAYLFDRRNLFCHKFGAVSGYPESGAYLTDEQLTFIHFTYVKIFRTLRAVPHVTVDNFMKCIIKYCREVTSSYVKK